MTTLKDIAQTGDDYRAKIRKEGKTAVVNTLKEFFIANPSMNAVRIRGYAPGFNDGDPCVFSLQEMHLQVGDGDFEYWEDIELDEAGDLAITELYDDLSSIEDALQLIFGDGFEVTCTRAGDLQIDEYWDQG